jgi:MarR family transcriptional regulator, transcriptional regulator for hemolysin
MQPAQTPIGLQLTQVSRGISRAFDEALAQAGGSLPIWQILLSMQSLRVESQRELAQAVGVREATLTHHLNAMEASGLITRRRDPANRRVHVVEVTQAGEAAFNRLRDTAIEFDAKLRQGMDDTQLATLADLLGKLASNAGVQWRRPPWSGLGHD